MSLGKTCLVGDDNTDSKHNRRMPSKNLPLFGSATSMLCMGLGTQLPARNNTNSSKKPSILRMLCMGLGRTLVGDSNTNSNRNRRILCKCRRMTIFDGSNTNSNHKTSLMMGV